MSLPQAYAFQKQPSAVIEWLTRLDELEPLGAEWRALESRVQTRTVFSTFDFLWTWYRNYGGEYGGDPLIGIARRDGKLVGAAPLVMRRGMLGKIPLTRVQFAMHDAYSGEFLVEDGSPEIVSSFIDALCANI